MQYRKNGMDSFKGIVHPKMKILSLIIHPHVVPNPKDLCSSSEHKLYFWWNLRAFWPCIESNTTTMFKAQKRTKDIVKIVTCDISGSADVTCDYCLSYVTSVFFSWISGSRKGKERKDDRKQSGRMIGGRIGKGPWVGIRMRYACGATALYVGFPDFCLVFSLKESTLVTESQTSLQVLGSRSRQISENRVVYDGHRFLDLDYDSFQSEEIKHV